MVIIVSEYQSEIEYALLVDDWYSWCCREIKHSENI